jgi:hypothetical protein
MNLCFEFEKPSMERKFVISWENAGTAVITGLPFSCRSRGRRCYELAQIIRSCEHRCDLRTASSHVTVSPAGTTPIDKYHACQLFTVIHRLRFSAQRLDAIVFAVIGLDGKDDRYRVVVDEVSKFLGLGLR